MLFYSGMWRSGDSAHKRSPQGIFSPDKGSSFLQKTEFLWYFAIPSVIAKYHRALASYIQVHVASFLFYPPRLQPQTLPPKPCVLFRTDTMSLTRARCRKLLPSLICAVPTCEHKTFCPFLLCGSCSFLGDWSLPCWKNSAPQLNEVISDHYLTICLSLTLPGPTTLRWGCASWLSIHPSLNAPCWGTADVNELIAIKNCFLSVILKLRPFLVGCRNRSYVLHYLAKTSKCVC